MTTLTHPTLIDPATNEPLEALGFRANGTPIWPMIGGSDGVSIPDMPEDDDDEDEGGNTQDSDDGDEKPKPKTPAKKKADDKDEDDSDEDEDEPWDEARARRAIAKKNRENQKLRAEAKLSKEDREELERLREEKLSEKEKLEKRAQKGETSSAELKAQLEETKLRLALGLPEPDDDDEDADDPFLDIPIKGETYEEKLANAKRTAKRYKIGRYAEKGDSQEEKPTNSRSRKTPPPKDLKGQRGNDDDPEDDPVKLADRMVKSKFGL